MGKHGHTPFKPCAANKRQDKALELKYSDLGEANLMSIGEKKYVLTFRDDATSHRTVFILADKHVATVLKAFKQY